MGFFDKFKKEAKEDVKAAEAKLAEQKKAAGEAREKAMNAAREKALEAADIKTAAVEKEAAEAKKQGNEKYKLKVDGEWGPKTITATQHLLGCTEDGICGTETIKAIQAKVGAKVDGEWGTETSKCMQKFLGVTEDGVAGPETFSAWQTWVNKELGF